MQTKVPAIKLCGTEKAVSKSFFLFFFFFVKECTIFFYCRFRLLFSFSATKYHTAEGPTESPSICDGVDGELERLELELEDVEDTPAQVGQRTRNPARDAP